MKNIYYFLLIAFIASLAMTGCKKSRTQQMREYAMKSQAISNAMPEDRCVSYRDSILQTVLGEGFVTEKKHQLSTDVVAPGFTDKGKVYAEYKGENRAFNFEIEVTLDKDNLGKWELKKLYLQDMYTFQYAYRFEDGKEQDVEAYNNAGESSGAETGSSRCETVSSSDIDLNAIEDALQREWNISNATSAVGAESSNVFNVHLKSIHGNVVTVSYDLRSTYNGKKKFVSLTGEVKKENGGWTVVNLGY